MPPMLAPKVASERAAAAIGHGVTILRSAPTNPTPTAPREEVPSSFLKAWDTFLPDEARVAIAAIFNRDLRNELTGRPYNFTREELSRVAWVQPNDPKIDQVVAALGITCSGQMVRVKFAQLRVASRIIHSTVNGALRRVERRQPFRYEIRNCKCTAEQADARAIVEACGGTWVGFTYAQ